MKSRITTLALATLACVPVLASAHAIMWPPGPSLWDVVLRYFGG